MAKEQSLAEVLDAATRATGVRLDDFAEYPARALAQHAENVRAVSDFQDRIRADQVRIRDDISALATFASAITEAHEKSLQEMPTRVYKEILPVITRIGKFFIEAADRVKEHEQLAAAQAEVIERQSNLLERYEKMLERREAQLRALPDTEDPSKLRQILNILKG